jgi:hypothetical protein
VSRGKKSLLHNIFHHKLFLLARDRERFTELTAFTSWRGTRRKPEMLAWELPYLFYAGGGHEGPRCGGCAGRPDRSRAAVLRQVLWRRVAHCSCQSEALLARRTCVTWADGNGDCKERLLSIIIIRLLISPMLELDCPAVSALGVRS